MSTESNKWWTNCGEIARLIRYLNEWHEPIDVRTCIEIVEKPWHWDAEYAEMVRVQESPERDRQQADEDVDALIDENEDARIDEMRQREMVDSLLDELGQRVRRAQGPAGNAYSRLGKAND